MAAASRGQQGGGSPAGWSHPSLKLPRSLSIPDRLGQPNIRPPAQKNDEAFNGQASHTRHPGRQASAERAECHSPCINSPARATAANANRLSRAPGGSTRASPAIWAAAAATAAAAAAAWGRLALVASEAASNRYPRPRDAAKQLPGSTGDAGDANRANYPRDRWRAGPFTSGTPGGLITLGGGSLVHWASMGPAWAQHRSSSSHALLAIVREVVAPVW